VAIFMENKPEFIGLWYGLSKLGVISALINTNLRNKTLLHSIEIAKPKVLVYGQELTDEVTQVKPSFSIKFEVMNQGNNKQSDTDNLESLLENYSDIFSAEEKVYGTDILMFIYTVSSNEFIITNRYLV
jgi:solute carrier family 27 fatty acid transporter 1/4